MYMQPCWHTQCLAVAVVVVLVAAGGPENIPEGVRNYSR